MVLHPSYTRPFALDILHSVLFVSVTVSRSLTGETKGWLFLTSFAHTPFVLDIPHSVCLVGSAVRRSIVFGETKIRISFTSFVYTSMFYFPTFFANDLVSIMPVQVSNSSFLLVREEPDISVGFWPQ